MCWSFLLQLESRKAGVHTRVCRMDSGVMAFNGMEEPHIRVNLCNFTGAVELLSCGHRICLVTS